MTVRVVWLGTLAGILGFVAILTAAPDAIGIASGKDAFLVDRAVVRGNATLFEGSVIETRDSAPTLRLGKELELQLGSGSRGKVFRDRLVLEQGAGVLSRSSEGLIQVRNLQVIPGMADSTARVALLSRDRVQVAAIQGEIDVRTLDGRLLAKVSAGRSLDFEPQAASAAPPFQVEGCLVSAEGAFLLTDATTKVSFELRGQDLSRFSGQYVQISATEWTGVKPATGASQVLRVVQIKQLPVGCPLASPQGRDGKRSGSQPARAAASAKTKAIVAGVAIAGGVSAVTVGLTGKEEDTTISR